MRWASSGKTILSVCVLEVHRGGRSKDWPGDRGLSLSQTRKGQGLGAHPSVEMYSGWEEDMTDEQRWPVLNSAGL